MSHRRSQDAPVEIVVDTSGWGEVVLDNLADLGSLWAADRLEPLYAALLGPRGRASGTDAFEPFLLFSRHHRDEPDGAAFTALLLCTDDRWNKAAGRLLRDIADCGFVTPEGLDDLAETFAWTDELWLQVPAAWLDWDAEAFARAGTVPVRRSIRPPLRRWAAERRVRRGFDDAETLVDRARSLPEQHGSAVALGLLDATDALSDDGRQTVLDAGLAWSRAAVRRRALEALVACGSADEARRRAADDPSATVRRWEAKLAVRLAASEQAGRQDRATPEDRAGADQPDESGDAGTVQGCLFV